MPSSYAYNSQIWLSFLTAVFLIALSVYSWRRRNVPGATPFLIGCLFGVLWAAGSVMEAAAVDAPTKIAWFKFQAACRLPLTTAITCFVLEYTWPGRWLNRRLVILLSIPCLLSWGLILTDGLFHLAWRGFAYDVTVVPLHTPINYVFMVYAYGLFLVNLIVLAWLFLRSPQHRWPVVIMLIGQIVGRGLFTLESTRILPPGVYLGLPPIAFEFLMYAIALFGFRIFDPVSLARQAVIAQIREGMLVLDLQGRVADLNPAAERILRLPARRLRSQTIKELIPAYPDGHLDEAEEIEMELSLGTAPDIRYYQLEGSVLKDWRGLDYGRLLLLHDVTAQRKAQAQLLEQQRALAMLAERERLARELHDGIGQVLGYVKLQSQAARDCLAQDQTAAADSYLEKLTAVAQDAHVDVREFILGATLGASGQNGFLAVLRQYLQRFSAQYGLRTELVEPIDWNDGLLGPTVEAQLLRIIQEALTNARKHAQAQCVQVSLHLDGKVAQVILQDDGAGFESERLAEGEAQRYGLGFMRERAGEVGGRVEIRSVLGEGTRVVVEVPIIHSGGITS